MRRSQKKTGGYRPSYVPGDFKRICDVSGFLVKASETRMQWDGLIVRLEDWTPRNPQDFVRGRADRQRVPRPRPEAADKFACPSPGTASGSSSVSGVGSSS